MQITTKTEYAIRSLMCINENNNQPLSIKDICKAQKLPVKYIEKLFCKLKKSGILKSLKGAKGGYFIAKDLDKISLKDIMQVVENNYMNISCNRENMNQTYCLGTKCEYCDFWEEIKNHLDSYFSSISLEKIYSQIKRGKNDILQ